MSFPGLRRCRRTTCSSARSASARSSAASSGNGPSIRHFAIALTEWLDVVLKNYGERILPLGVDIARRWGRLSAKIGNNGIDRAIAATALEHGLTIATRHVSDFAANGAALFDPFEPRPQTR